jgi:hypothetical protein
MKRLLAGLILLAGGAVFARGEGRKTENVIFVMTDGLRRQEVFTGAEEALLNTLKGEMSEAWNAEPADAITFRTARELLAAVLADGIG